MTFVGPFFQQRAARAWTPAEATVEHSRVRSHSGDDSTTYNVDIAYRYRIGGREYRGDRYQFSSGSSSGCEGKRRVVDAHPPGSPFIIYVNPADPHDSVICRDMGASLYLGLLPLIFAVVGGIVMTLGFRQGRQLGCPAIAPGAWTMRPAWRGAKLLGLLLFILIWNGVLSIFIAECVGQWRKGRPPILMTLFLIPFVAVGIATVAGFLAEILRLFNPRILLQPPALPLIPGKPAVITFRCRGRIDRLTRLTFHLVERETSSGNDSEITTHESRRAIIHEIDHSMLMAAGSFRLTLPADMSSRRAATGDRVSWSIDIKGNIPFWPDLVETYRLTASE